MVDDGMSDDGLPSLRSLIDLHDLQAKKSLGQNFLLDLNITRKIARLADVRPGARFIEVGPGPGGLTRGLLMEGAEHLVVIERDARMQPLLQEVAAAYPGKLDVQIADATNFDWQSPAYRPYEVVANLPYNVGTALLTDWLSLPWPLPFAKLTLMFQEEVAERIVADCGGKAYGRLSVLANWRMETDIVYRLPRGAFTPPPKVSSAVVQLVPKATLAYDVSPHTVARVTAAAFGQRRKMLRQSLKGLIPDVGGLLQALDLDPTNRAENLSWQDFCRIADALEQHH